MNELYEAIEQKILCSGVHQVNWVRGQLGLKVFGVTGWVGFVLGFRAAGWRWGLLWGAGWRYASGWWC